ncbi:hypothetical protein Tco_0753820 [Tanacetum coccineum]
MAPDHSSLGHVLHEMTPDQISLDLTPNRQETYVDNISSDLVSNKQKASDYDISGPVPCYSEYWKNQRTVRRQWLILHRSKQCRMNFTSSTDHKSGNSSTNHLARHSLDFVAYAAKSFHLPDGSYIGILLIGTLKGGGFSNAFSDVEHAECIDTRKALLGGIQFLGDKLVKARCQMKQYCNANIFNRGTVRGLSASCSTIMWMRTQLTVMASTTTLYMVVLRFQSAIAIS